jgi:hypothetical protein
MVAGKADKALVRICYKASLVEDIKQAIECKIAGLKEFIKSLQ